MLSARSLVKRYGNMTILKEVSLEIMEGEIVCITGASGAGKSSLLHILGTLDKPDSGELLFKGRSLSQMSHKDQATFRNTHLGFVFQFHHLLPEFNALENVCMPAWISGKTGKPVMDKAMSLLERFNLSQRMNHKPAALSGGEQQRVAMARALVNSPDLILADEPTGNLDSHHATQLFEAIFQLRQDFRQTFVIVTHNEELASRADRILHMADGQIVSES